MTLTMKAKLGLSAGAALAAVLGAPGAAFAADTNVDIGTGDGTWVEQGDTLIVCDSAGDGKGVRGYIYYPKAGDNRNGTVIFQANDPSHANGCVSVSHNVPEYVSIGLKVCNYRGASITNCDFKLLR